MNDEQRVILDIFKAFDRICRENDIPYYAIGGTCIGAIRHKGFIPWDDDMDVSIPIEYFEKFIKIATRDLPSYYKIFSSNEVKHYRYLFIKIIDLRTTFIEKMEFEYEDTYKGIFLDIMPISGIPNGVISKQIFKFRQSYYYIMNNTVRYPIDYVLKGNNESRSIWKYAYFFSRLLKKRDYNYYTKKWLELLKHYPFYESKLTGYVWNNKLGKLIFLTKNFGDGKRLPFEDTTIICPTDYHSYLTTQFGDYMKLPPEEQRTVCHSGIVDINSSFSEYLGKLNRSEKV